MMLNPVLRREARTSLRNWKIYGAITLYVSIVAVAAWLFIWGTMYSRYSYGFNPKEIMGLYIIMSCIQFGLVLITTPALTAGSISGERERQTLDLLLMTKMTPLSIIIGKLLSCIGLILLMTIASMPIFAIIFYFGGLSLISLFGMTAFMILVSCAMGAMSIFFSTLIKKTVVSMVIMYLVTGMLCGGTVIIYVITCEYYSNIVSGSLPMFVRLLMLGANPALGFASILDSSMGAGFINEVFNIATYSNGNPVVNYLVLDFWAINAIVLVCLTIIFVLIAAKKLSKISSK